MNELKGEILNWHKDGEGCRVCGNEQFTIRDVSINDEVSEMLICDCCKFTYLIGEREINKDSAITLGFLPTAAYFSMLINGDLGLSVDLIAQPDGTERGDFRLN